MGHLLGRMQRRATLFLCIVVLASGCASVDFDYPKTESTAFSDTSDTRSGQLLAAELEAHSGLSGFHLQFDGIHALAARLLLARVAERSIDAQYYLITDDDIGLLFIGALLQAADRGVRVRLLLDDFQAQGYDSGMAALDSHPHFEVRIFNPFAGRTSRFSDGLIDFYRINRRMHNKSFTVDNQTTIIGGRNIAAEYFGARDDVNFGDVDVLSVGPLVREVSTMFDTYWNDISAAPLPAFAKMPLDPSAELERLRERISQAETRLEGTVYAGALAIDVERYKVGDDIYFEWAPHILAYDTPDKVRGKQVSETSSIVRTLADAVERAEHELIVISPYFVPLKSGLAFLQAQRDRGIAITVITNSLAATNHSIVHSGYAPARKPLLKMGVLIREMKYHATLSGAKRGGKGSSLATLHTKAMVVDRHDLFIGSFNWDPRSINLNTESGVIIQSPTMAADFARQLDETIDDLSYEVVLDESGRLRWLDHAGPTTLVYDKEPDTGIWRRFGANILRILPIRQHL